MVGKTEKLAKEWVVNLFTGNYILIENSNESRRTILDQINSVLEDVAGNFPIDEMALRRRHIATYDNSVKKILIPLKRGIVRFQGSGTLKRFFQARQLPEVMVDNKSYIIPYVELIDSGFITFQLNT